jgi:hypothetical protein
VGDVVVYGGRGGGEHRFGHGIYAGSLGLGVSDSYGCRSLGRSDDCKTTEALSGVLRIVLCW